MLKESQEEEQPAERERSCCAVDPRRYYPGFVVGYTPQDLEQLRKIAAAKYPLKVGKT